MLTRNIIFKNFSKKNNNFLITKDLKKILKENVKKNNLLYTLTKNFNYSFKKKSILKLKEFLNIRIIGMGGSILGTEAIYDFLKHKIKKKFYFINNLNATLHKFNNKKKILNLIVSKSGETLETILNVNILIKKKDKKIYHIN